MFREERAWPFPQRPLGLHLTPAIDELGSWGELHNLDEPRFPYLEVIVATTQIVCVYGWILQGNILWEHPSTMSGGWPVFS